MSSDSDSESDDLDYVPGGEEDVSEEDSSGEDEGGAVKPKAPAKDALTRPRRGGIKLDDDDDDDDAAASGGEEKAAAAAAATEEEEARKEQEAKKQEKEKQKGDDLWSSFLSDVGPRPKAAVAEEKAAGAKAEVKTSSAASEAKPYKPPTQKKTVTVTQEFDFAGEKVKVEKEVSADSREAKQQLQQSSSSSSSSTAAPPRKTGLAALSGPGVKRPGGLSAVLGKLNKKPKISVLDKSKLDWNSFKAEKGIGDELAIHNRGKEGYIERQQFLQRADLRQFEIEKNLRKANSKKQ